jgi:hypothetical protein
MTPHPWTILEKFAETRLFLGLDSSCGQWGEEEQLPGKAIQKYSELDTLNALQNSFPNIC